MAAESPIGPPKIFYTEIKKDKDGKTFVEMESIIKFMHSIVSSLDEANRIELGIRKGVDQAVSL